MASKGHSSYFLSLLRSLPSYYVGLETTRVTAIYFCVVGLDILSEWDGETEINQHKQAIIDYILALQLIYPSDYTLQCGGFIGGTYLGQQYKAGGACLSDCVGSGRDGHLKAHIAATYSALCALATLGYDLSLLDTNNILRGLSLLQLPSGSFQSVIGDDVGENDIRFVYCAAAICGLLNDFSYIDSRKATSYILSCVNYDGGMGLVPGAESQGGALYCGLAALTLLNGMSALNDDTREDIIHWCMMRHNDGVQGRVNKEPDSCYSFWVGAALALLDPQQFSSGIDQNVVKAFLLTKCCCAFSPDDDGDEEQAINSRQIQCIGFSKVPGAYPDILHSFYGLLWLSMNRFVLREADKSAGTSENVLNSLDSCLQELPAEMISPSRLESSSTPNSKLEIALKPIDLRFAICADRVPRHLLSNASE